MESNNKSDYLERTNGGSSFSGGDQDIFRAALLAGHIDLYNKTGMKPTRGVGPTQMLKFATEYTGKKYKRTELAKAAEDLRGHVNFLKAHPKTAIPLPRFPTE